MKKSKSVDNNGNKVFALIMGIVVAYILTLGLLFLLAFISYKYRVDEKYISIGIVLTYIISNFIAGFTIGKATKKNRWLWGALGGAIYVVIMILIGLIINKEVAELSAIVLHLLICSATSMLGGMLS